MSQLDHHVAKVQGKMLTTGLLQALAWSLLAYGGVVWLVILITRLLGFGIWRKWTLLGVGLAIACVVALVFALRRRPTPQVAAVAIDERLGLKEKFSTALYVRKSSDPFEAAAVRDAELTAERVHLQDKFPVRFPLTGLFTFAMIVVAFLTGWLLQPMDLLGRKAEAAKLEQQDKKNAEVNQEIRKAIAKIESAPPLVQKDPKVEMAVRDLKTLLNRPAKDPTASARKAQDALEEVRSQMQKVKELRNAAEALNEMQAWKDLAKKPIDESGPVGKAQSAMAKGEFSKAIDMLKQTVDNIDKMDQKEKEKAADQMAAMAQQMRDMANNPQQQKKMQDQLQKEMGANKPQAQQMVKDMQAAANGDKQAQQRVQQQANNMLQQMNNGQGPNQQQIAQAQGLLNQLQQQANGQAQAQQLAQNAANIAKAMQQVAQQGQQGQQGQNGQQQPNQQGQQAQAQAQQGGPGQQQQQQPQQGGQQPGAQQGNQAAQQAQAQMQQQVAQMQAMADAAAQQQQQQGQQPGNAGQQGNQPGNQPGNNPGQQMAQGNQPGGAEGQQGEGGKEGNGEQNPNGGGQGGWAKANGAGQKPQPAPFDVKAELSNSQTIEKGKLLASNYVKASALKGESKAQLKRVVEAAESDAADEVDQSRVTRQARQAVKEYHRSVAKDVGAAVEKSK
jgi:hypothetical protein